MAAVPKSQRLAIVLDVAEREKDQAAQAFEQAQRRLADENGKLQQLAHYYQEYQQHFASVAGLRAEDLIKQRHFLQQLADAQKQQQAVIGAATQALDQQRELWQRAHLKHRNLSDLIDRYKIQEAADLGRKEQKMLDEWYQQSLTSR